MSSFKKFKKSDIVLSPIVANKEWEFVYNILPSSDDELVILKGKNITGSFNPASEPINSNGTYERLLYQMINHTFYQNYTASLNTQSLSMGTNYESASQDRPTGSYFVFDENPNFINNFPTGANEVIRVLNVKQGIYGNKVKQNTFLITSSAYRIEDDGYGNLYDNVSTSASIATASMHVGNIFYPQGIAVITNQDYKFMFPVPPNAIDDYFLVLNTRASKILSPIFTNDYSDISASLVTGSWNIYPVNGYDFPTYISSSTNSGSIALTTQTDLLEVTPGIYKLKYTIEDTLGLVSNEAEITLELYQEQLRLEASGAFLLCSPTGTATANFTAYRGVPPYNYYLYKEATLYNTGSLTLSWYDPTGSISALPSGSYRLILKDRYDEEVSQYFDIVPKISFSASVDYSQVCSSSILFNNVTGGVAPYSYSISNSAAGGLITSSNTAVSFSNRATQTGWVTRVTDNNGCYNEAFIPVRGRYFTYSGSHCEFLPDNINWEINGTSFSGSQFTLEILSNNISKSTATVLNGGDASGSISVNYGDTVTFRMSKQIVAGTNITYRLETDFTGPIITGSMDITQASQSLDVSHTILDNFAIYTFEVNF
jgi:hypothetical protein